jgi:hypothetical protein
MLGADSRLLGKLALIQRLLQVVLLLKSLQNTSSTKILSSRLPPFNLKSLHSCRARSTTTASPLSRTSKHSVQESKSASALPSTLNIFKKQPTNSDCLSKQAVNISLNRRKGKLAQLQKRKSGWILSRGHLGGGFIFVCRSRYYSVCVGFF